MTNKTLFKYGVAGAAMLGFAVLGGQGAYAAACGTTANPALCVTTAKAEILAVIAIDEKQKLDFGKIIPSSSGGPLVCTLTQNGTGGTLVCGGGVGGKKVSGHIEGQYDITGSVGETYSFGVTAGACGGAIGLSNMTNNAGTVLNDLVEIGGKLTIPDNEPAANLTCIVTVSAGY